MLPKLHLLTFADNHLSQFGLNTYNKKAERLIGQSHQFSLFSKIHYYTAESLFQKYPEFLAQHKDFLESNLKKSIWKGYGYWIWKPFLIWKTLQEIDEGDILLYSDTGCELHVSGKERFLEYLDIVKNNKHGNLFFGMSSLIKNWAKMDTVKYFNAEKIILAENKKEIIPGLLFTTNTEENRKFFKLFYESCCNYHLIDDSPSVSPNITTFKEHRHDQSIFSILVHQHCADSIADIPMIEVYHPEHKDDPAYAKYPMTIQSNTA
jgi:hypothetical protein